MNNLSHTLHREIDRVAAMLATYKGVTFQTQVIWNLADQCVAEAIELTNTPPDTHISQEQYQEYQRRKIDLIIELSYYR